MTWLAWRQFRANVLLATVTTVAVVVVLAITRDHMARVVDPADLSTGYDSLQLLGTVLIGVPALIGAFWGAPLLAREIETGTHRLAWTQSVSRRCWLATKLAGTGVVTVAVTGVFSLVFTWWSVPLDRFGNRIGTADFDQRGIAPVAYGLFALALGTFVGAVLRRTLPAMAVTLVGFVVVRESFQWLVRPRLLDPVTASLPNNLFGQRQGEASSGGWILSSRTVDGAGHALTSAQIDRVLADSCELTRDSPRAAWVACADRLGFHDIVRMHPADHFWPLQTWESASFVALAALLTMGCFWWIRHRMA